MKRTRRSRPSADLPIDLTPFPTSDEIAARAHELFVSGGRQIRRVHEYWQVAEAELLDRAARRLVKAL